MNDGFDSYIMSLPENATPEEVQAAITVVQKRLVDNFNRTFVDVAPVDRALAMLIAQTWTADHCPSFDMRIAMYKNAIGELLAAIELQQQGKSTVAGWCELAAQAVKSQRTLVALMTKEDHGNTPLH